MEIKHESRGLPWWLSSKESTFQCRRYRFNPWSQQIPHAAEHLRPRATIIEPVNLWEFPHIWRVSVYLWPLTLWLHYDNVQAKWWVSVILVQDAGYANLTHSTMREILPSIIWPPTCEKNTNHKLEHNMNHIKLLISHCYFHAALCDLIRFCFTSVNVNSHSWIFFYKVYADSTIEITSLFLCFYFIFYWRVIALQNFVVFCQTSTWISHRYTYIPSSLNLSPIFLPIPPL